MLPDRILQFARDLREGSVFTAADLHSLGNRAAIDQALHRLAKSGQLMKIGRGMYVLPIRNRFGIRGPDVTSLLADIASKTNEPIVRHGAFVANALGLTLQVPVHEIWVTAGRPRSCRIGKLNIRVDQVPKWQMIFPNERAGDAIRAIAWMGEKNAPASVRKLRYKLTETDWEKIVGVAVILPAWMADAIRNEKGASCEAPSRSGG